MIVLNVAIRRFLLIAAVGFVAFRAAEGWSDPQVAAESRRERDDDEKFAVLGIRSIHGQHVVVRTDARDRSDVDAFAEVFDQAVPQWEKFFGVDPQRLAEWKLEAMIVVDQQRFERAGLFPADLPQFLAGYQRGPQIWVYLQQGDYYTRHLLIHEGTHAVMNQFLGGLAAPWYAEGMAELVGLNQWRDGKLTIAYPVTSRDDVPYWGRVALIQKAVKEGDVKSLEDVFAIPAPAFRQVESYAWAWAACEFLSRHPGSRSAFAELIKHCGDDPATFNQRLTESLPAQWRDLEFEWRMYLNEIDYGYDVERAALETAVGERDRFKIAADRGWQATSVAVEKGKPLTIVAEGEFQIAHDGQPWPCQANGVTIEYYRGKPLGRLIGAIRPRQDGEMLYPEQLEVLDIGDRATIVPEFDGVLWLRVNESPAHWRDNQGSLTVSIQ